LNSNHLNNRLSDSSLDEHLIYYSVILRSMNLLHFLLEVCFICHSYFEGPSWRDRTVVGFTTTCAISAYHHWCEFKSRSGRGVQDYMIKFVSDLRQVGGFLWILQFPPPIKLTATIYWNIVESGIKHHQTSIKHNYSEMFISKYFRFSFCRLNLFSGVMSLSLLYIYIYDIRWYF